MATTYISEYRTVVVKLHSHSLSYRFVRDETIMKYLLCKAVFVEEQVFFFKMARERSKWISTKYSDLLVPNKSGISRFVTRFRETVAVVTEVVVVVVSVPANRRKT